MQKAKTGQGACPCFFRAQIFDTRKPDALADGLVFAAVLCLLVASMPVHPLPMDLSAGTWYAQEGFSEKDAAGLTGARQKVPGFPVSMTRIFKPAIQGQTIEYAMETQIELTPEQVEKGHLAVFLRGLGDNWELYVNGRLIQSELFLDANGAIRIRRTSMGQIVPLDARALKGGQNTIVLRLVGTAEPSMMLSDSVPGLFFSEDYIVAEESYLREHFSEKIDIALIAVYMFFGLYHLLLFTARRTDVHALFFGAFCVFVSLYSVTRSFWIYDLIIDSSWITRAENLFVSTLVPLFFVFLQSYLYPGQKFGRLLRSVILLHALFTLAFLVGPFPYYAWIVVPWKYVTLATIALYGPFFVVRSLLKHARDARLLATALALFLGVTLFDLVRDAAGLFAMEPLFQYAFFGFILAIAGMLSIRMIQVFNEKDRLYREVENSNQLLRNLDRLKDEFIGTISHEIRTPLNGIIGLCEALIWDSRRTLDSDTLKTLELVVQSGRRLSRLVSDLIEFIQLKNKVVPVHPAPVQLHEAVDIAVSLLRPQVRKTALVIENNVPPDFPPVKADPDRLQQILNNLIWNSVKFTEAGRIAIEARVATDSIAEVSVTDTGIGIPDEKQGLIFEAFRQADSSVNRPYEGIGLGLSITRHLVELHGGSISVSSRVGLGSSFTFTMPVVAGSKTVEPDLQALPAPLAPELKFQRTPWTSSARARILAVDDDAINLEVLKRQLEHEGFEVICASGGEDALQVVKDTPPDVVICDIMMPRISGYDVCREIRMTYTNHEMPVLLLTARTQLPDVLRGFEEGANDYLTKPYDYRELSARLNGLLTVRRTAREKAAVAALEKELSIARDIQRSVLPLKAPETPGLTVASRFRPRETVGGDFYDFHATPAGLEILVADVSGHGVPAALITAMIKIAFAQDKEITNPAQRLGRINRALTGNLDRNFVTAFALHIDVGSREAAISCAGHPPMVHVRPGAPTELRTARGKVMGLLADPVYASVRFNISPGDILLIYTDGLTEARNPGGELFGEERLIRTAESLAHLSADEIATRLEGLVVAWASYALDDDMAFVVVKADP